MVQLHALAHVKVSRYLFLDVALLAHLPYYLVEGAFSLRLEAAIEAAQVFL